MRDIKFRAWSKEYNKFEAYTLEQIVSGKVNLWFFKESPIVHQFIGHKDKNQKDIFEGDIVEKDGETWLILWDEYRAGFRFLSIKFEKRKFKGVELRMPESVACQKYLMNEMTVIGNSYQNPELLNINANLHK